MKLKDVLKLNEMAAVSNAESVVRLIKAGKYDEAVQEMFKEKKLKVVPGNIAALITKEEKAKFAEALKKENPSAKRGPGEKAAVKKIENAVTSGITSTQSQESIKKKLMATLDKAQAEVQKDPTIPDEEKESNRLALELLKNALEYTIARGSTTVNSLDIKASARKVQDKIKQEFLKKNAPEVFKKAEEMAKEHKEDIEDYIEARKAYIEKIKKEEGRDTTPAKDIKTNFDSGLLLRRDKLKTDYESEFDKKLGTDDETIKKEIEKEDAEALKIANANLEKKLGETNAEKQYNEAKAEVARLEKKLKEAIDKKREQKVIKDLEEKLQAAKDVANEAKKIFIAKKIKEWQNKKIK